MDDFDRFGLEMEIECLVTTFQALVETVGSEATIKLLRPYFEMSGKAFALNLGDWTKGDDVYLKLAKNFVIGWAPLGVDCKSFRIVKGEAFFEREECPFLGTLPEICECYCNIIGKSSADQIDPDIGLEMSRGTGRDNPLCKWRFFHTAGPLQSELSDRDLDIESIKSQIPEEEWRWRSHHYTGGVWYMVTYAMVESLGSEVMLDSLSSHMRRNGSSFGLRIKKYQGIEGRDVGSIARALETFSKTLMQKQTVRSTDPEELEVEVEDCMWSIAGYATPEHCQLVESINDGICKSINPEYEFRYASMKTKGADRCVWKVKRKSLALKAQSLDSKAVSTNQDLITLLKERLVKGEITLEQYEKIAQVLK
jgi:hypothetical protein